MDIQTWASGMFNGHGLLTAHTLLFVECSVHIVDWGVQCEYNSLGTDRIYVRQRGCAETETSSFSFSLSLSVSLPALVKAGGLHCFHQLRGGSSILLCHCGWRVCCQTYSEYFMCSLKIHSHSWTTSEFWLFVGTLMSWCCFVVWFF